MKRILTMDLLETRVGWWIARQFVPLGLVIHGGLAIWKGEILVKRAEVLGGAAICYGVGFCLLGLGGFELRKGRGYGKWASLRLVAFAGGGMLMLVGLLLHL